MLLNSGLILWGLLFRLILLLIISLVLLCLWSNRGLLFSRSGFYFKFLQILDSASVKSLQLHRWCIVLYFAICADWIKLVLCIHLLVSHFMVFQNFPNQSNDVIWRSLLVEFQLLRANVYGFRKIRKNMFFDLNTVKVCYKLPFLDDIRKGISLRLNSFIWSAAKIFYVLSYSPCKGIEFGFRDKLEESNHLKK